MDILEIEKKETMSREEAAARLRAFADTLSHNNDIEFERGGMQIKVHVPDEVRRQGRAGAGDGRAGAGDRAELVTVRQLAGGSVHISSGPPDRARSLSLR